MPGSGKSSAKSTPASAPAEATPHYHGHRQRLRQRLLHAGAEAVRDYELLELILFRAIHASWIREAIQRDHPTLA